MPVCQTAFSHQIWHIVLWRQQWAFCHLLSSANSTSNCGPATNLITVAEEMGWFNSFQLNLIGPVKSNFTHLRYKLPVTFYLSLAQMKHYEQVLMITGNIWLGSIKQTHVPPDLWLCDQCESTTLNFQSRITDSYHLVRVPATTAITYAWCPQLCIKSCASMCTFRYPTKRCVAHSKNYAVSAEAAHEVTFSEPPSTKLN